MTRATHTTTGPIYLHFHGIEEELDAIWSVESETYPAEPYSTGGGRGDETETTSATLISWHRQGMEYDRAEAVQIAGEAEVMRQEEYVRETFAPGETMPLFDARAAELVALRRGWNDIMAAMAAE